MTIDGSDFANTHDLDFTQNAEPLTVVVTPTRDSYDPVEMVFIVHLSDEGIIIDFYQDGQPMRTSAQTWQEWVERALPLA